MYMRYMVDCTAYFKFLQVSCWPMDLLSTQWSPTPILYLAIWQTNTQHTPSHTIYNIICLLNTNSHTLSTFLCSYELMSLCASAEGCMRALLGHELPQLDSSAVDRPPQAAAVASMEKTIAYHSESPLSACTDDSYPGLPMFFNACEKI